ncbi:MAG: DEAD/DEAH box helicase, partial [Chromatiaceae bacterium]
MSAVIPFSEPTARWFDDTFEAPTGVQQAGWASILDGAHTLMAAPTGSGKTLAAFLAGIDHCLCLPHDAPEG